MARTGWQAVAEKQSGAVHRDQLLSASVSPSGIKRLVAAGTLRPRYPKVFVMVGAPPSFLQDVWAAQLWSKGGIVCGTSAALLLGLDVPRSSTIEINVPARVRRPPGLIVRRGEIARRDQTQLRGLAVTTMPRTVIDCARSLTELQTDVLLDSAIRQGMRRSLFLDRMDAICVPGRPGGALVRKLVAERESEQGLTGSAFERILLRIIKNAGLPTPICQWPCLDEGFRAYIDLAYPEHGIAIEADGYRWHEGRQAFESDRARSGELASRGWRVIQVTWLQLKYEPGTVVERLGRALRTPALVQLRS